MIGESGLTSGSQSLVSMARLSNATQVPPYMSGCSHSLFSVLIAEYRVLISVIAGGSCSHEACSHLKIENDAKAKIPLMPFVFFLGIVAA